MLLIENKDYGFGLCKICERYAIIKLNEIALCEIHMEEAFNNIGRIIKDVAGE